MSFVSITGRVVNFIRNIGIRIREDFTGRSKITMIIDNRETIEDIIVQGLESTSYNSQSLAAEIHFNEFLEFSTNLKDAYDDWLTTKNNHDDSSESVRRYTRLSGASSLTQQQREHYGKLLSRAESSKGRRKTIMDNAFNNMIQVAKDTGEIAITAWNDYINLKGSLGL